MNIKSVRGKNHRNAQQHFASQSIIMSKTKLTQKKKFTGQNNHKETDLGNNQISPSNETRRFSAVVPVKEEKKSSRTESCSSQLLSSFFFLLFFESKATEKQKTQVTSSIVRFFFRGDVCYFCSCSWKEGRETVVEEKKRALPNKNAPQSRRPFPFRRKLFQAEVRVGPFRRRNSLGVRTQVHKKVKAHR